MFEAHAQAPASAPDTIDETVPIDPAFVLSKVQSWVVGFQKLLPTIVVALVLFAVVFGVA